MLNTDNLEYEQLTVEQAVSQYDANYQKVMNIIPEPIKSVAKTPRQPSEHKPRQKCGLSELEKAIVEVLTKVETRLSPRMTYQYLPIELKDKYEPKQVTNKMWAMAKKGIIVGNSGGVYQVKLESGASEQ